MVAKLLAYRYDDDWEYSNTSIITDTVIDAFVNHETVLLPNHSYADLQGIDTNFGLLFRVIEGYNDLDQLTKAIIIGWVASGDASKLQIKNQDDVGGWTNGIPKSGTTMTVSFKVAKEYMSRVPHVKLDVSVDVIDDTLEITKEIESIQKFDLLLSSATVELDASDAIKEFISTYWTADKVGAGGVPSGGFYFAMGLEIEGRFVGYVAPENIIYDEEIDTYHIEAYDWIKFLQHSKWKNFIPSYLNPNLTDFLVDNCFVFQGKSVITNVTSPEIWDTLNYRAFYHNLGNTEDFFYRTMRDMTILDFFVETFKHYNAVMYYDGDGNLNFHNRGSISATTHNNEADIVTETMEESFRLRDYNSLVINVKGEWRLSGGSFVTYEGFALIWLEDGGLQSKTTDLNLNNLPDKYNYLDLRQDFNGRWFGYLMFTDRTREQRLLDYGELLEDKPVIKLDVHGFGYNLYDTFVKDSERYRIISIEENDTQGTSRLELEKYILTSGDSLG